MKRLLMILLGIGVIALAVSLASLTPDRASAVPVCGPGFHWIDSCSPGGTDSLSNTSALVELDEVGGDCVGDVTVTLSGPTEIVRQAASDDSANFPGTRPVDAHLDVIDTEIVSMSLTGASFTLRVGAGGGPALSASQGAVAEQSGDPTLGDSFFDVFFVIDDGGPDLYYNQSALRIKAVLLAFPPEPVYPPAPVICLDLFSAPSGGFDTGINLVDFQFDPEPPAAVGGIEIPFDDSGFAVGQSASSAGSSAPPYAALTGAVAAATVALAAGAWYARRRWLR